ncbi:PLP-dependent aminotransferase family protein [Komagataeibacter sp. FNDCF1]|uniref:MocR-like pyridoxine biosynthesis transcription factor PdxR n=1 Tax=Komagataeibacter sp. FNDCF1 TaxID=2878681 RepID=UPI001E4E1360|nr:PLP-dependent aminotransferase family protein [Komagataeibacter sp. FNDCF1]MCE2564135.1 PLP-dependent aminotransferase family protein [Komagataeibacter sp. FNDCF1]
MGRRTRAAVPLGIALDATGPDTLHGQIREQIRGAILQGRLACGARLPSSRLMAAELGCSRGTVLAALDQLVAEGYLVARAASGLSVARDLPDEMLAPAAVNAPSPATHPGPPILPERTKAILRPATGLEAPMSGAQLMAFPIGQPDRESFPFPLWAKFLERDWRRPVWDMAGSCHPFGHPELRQAIASYLGTARGFSCEPDAVVITSGVRQSVSLFARIVLEAGDQAWIEEPGYPGIAEALLAAAVRPVAIPVDGSGFAPAAALAAAPDARLAIVAPSHHFPFGTVLGLQRRLALLAWAQRTGGWIIEDDFDGEYRYTGRPLAPLRALDRAGRVAYLGSFSKLLFPALRLSYIVLPATLVPVAQTVMQRISAPAPLLGQGALARFIAEGHLISHLRRTRLLYAGRQQRLMEAVERHLAGLMTVVPDSGGMHVVARPVGDLASAFDDSIATAAVAATGVRVAPLSICYRGADRQHGFLLGYAGTPEHEIDPAVRILARVLEHMIPAP